MPDERRTANAETGSTARRASREAGRATRDARGITECRGSA
ncbi:hypothetical protein BMA10399_G0731 [Burkholderia mallei ATCC 10399]|nr:hypothetical protein BMA10399_G0731 [Burkholderia mallei ATCC 10399]